MYEYSEHFTRLFAYDAWANQETLASLRKSQEPPARSLKFVAHILAAERLWLDRLEQKGQPPQVWPEFTFEQCETSGERSGTTVATLSGDKQRRGSG